MEFPFAVFIAVASISVLVAIGSTILLQGVFLEWRSQINTEKIGIGMMILLPVFMLGGIIISNNPEPKQMLDDVIILSGVLTLLLNIILLSDELIEEHENRRKKE